MSALTPDASSTTRTAPRHPLKRYAAIIAMMVWAFAVGAGVSQVWKYNSTAGAAVMGPKSWPGSTAISPQSGKATGVMFVHPRCPCSRASLAELSKIVEREQGRLSTWVLFLHPSGTAADWERTDSWKTAERIPGVTVLTDVGGAEASRFGVATSGHFLLYDTIGRLLFSGGITGSRGHVGDNRGEQSVVDLMEGRTTARADHPVYGCGFRDLDTPDT